jgi:glycosyltransferase involved in cell wall biosynthesis
MKLSILTPSIPSRADRLARLSASIANQIGDLPVEHLVFIDNKRRTIGEKRDNLLRLANGEFIAFVDDDDAIRPGYVEELLKAIEGGPDVITFEQDAYFDGVRHHVRFGHGMQNDELNREATTQRAAWHVCAWRRTVALRSRFPWIQYGEDWAFCVPLNKMDLVEVHIPKVLHEYHYRTDVTEAK